jgi:hypothetical protein
MRQMQQSVTRASAAFTPQFGSTEQAMTSDLHKATAAEY